MGEPTEQGRSGLDLADFAGQAWAALRSGVVRYGVVIEVPAEGMQSHAQGLLDLSAGSFAQRVRTLIAHLPPDADTGENVGTGVGVDVGAQVDTAADVEVDDTTPQYFADEVLSMPIPQDGGSRRWVRLQGCTVADRSAGAYRRGTTRGCWVTDCPLRACSPAQVQARTVPDVVHAVLLVATVRS